MLYPRERPHYIHMEYRSFQRLVAEQFPTLKEMVYANHAAITPWPRVADEAMREFAAENCELGPMRVGRWVQREKRLRELLARMLNASSDDIALCGNTSDGVCTVANGIDWRPGDNLVTPSGEYPSNWLAWAAKQGLGVEIRQIDIESSADPEGALLDAIDGRTRVLALSAVRFDNGFRYDMERLGAGCGDTEALFFVDAIQQLGALPLDVRACGIDALSAGAHKWQLGPEGVGVFYCNEATRRELSLSKHGWRMFDNPFHLEQKGRQPSVSARRFEAGSLNTAGQAAWFASLCLLEEVGFEQVGSLVLENTRRLVKGISAIPGLQVTSSTDPHRQSGIVSVQPAHMEPKTLRHELSKQKCFVAVRGGAVRFSMHFYQHGEPVERLLGALADVVV